MVGLAPYGRRLEEHGFPHSLASALDFGNASEAMNVAIVIGLGAFVIGVLEVRNKRNKGSKFLATIGIVTGGLVAFGPFLLALL
jgi:hypothetical protein